MAPERLGPGHGRLAGPGGRPGGHRSALTVLTGDPDIDVRAVAAAALHATHDDDHPALRPLLAAPAAPPSSAPSPLPSTATSAATPPDRSGGADRPRRRAGGGRQPCPGRGSLQDALGLDPDHPVALVNLGLGLEALGRDAEAEAAYDRAATARPSEALAHFNLGNARFRRGDLLGAGVAYRAAVESDPGLARAHFYLAVVLVNGGGDLEEALSALYNAAEFAPDDEEVRRVLQQVEAAVTRPGG